MYEWLWPALVACADFKLGALDAAWRAAPTWWWFFLAAPATLVWLCRWPWVLRLSAACALLPLWFEPPRAPPTASVALHVLDAGRGTAALLQTRHHVLLFDTGDAWNTRGARLTELVLPALDALDLERVDGLVLPRLDEDRARAAALLALDRQLTRAHVVSDWPGSGVGARCRDATWSWDGVGFTTYAQGLHCLLRVFVPGHAILLAGDLDAAAESALLARLLPGALVSDVVVIGRQASDLGSSKRWIENTDPGLAIATGGIAQAQSRQRVLARWRGRARVLDTRNEGAVVLELSARGIALERVARTSRYPFHWRRPPV
jgi:competence protein ComEC